MDDFIFCQNLISFWIVRSFLHILYTNFNIRNDVFRKIIYWMPCKFYTLIRFGICNFSIPLFYKKDNSYTLFVFSLFFTMYSMNIFHLFRFENYPSFFLSFTNPSLGKCFSFFHMSGNESVPSVHIASILSEIEQDFVSSFEDDLYFWDVGISHKIHFKECKIPSYMREGILV